MPNFTCGRDAGQLVREKSSPMTTIKDFIPPGVKRGFLVSVALLALFVSGSHLRSALTTGVAQRLPDTPKYTRDQSPFMFWLLVVFFASSVMLFTALLVAVIVHWNDEKIL